MNLLTMLPVHLIEQGQLSGSPPALRHDREYVHNPFYTWRCWASEELRAFPRFGLCGRGRTLTHILNITAFFLLIYQLALITRKSRQGDRYKKPLMTHSIAQKVPPDTLTTKHFTNSAHSNFTPANYRHFGCWGKWALQAVSKAPSLVPS